VGPLDGATRVARRRRHCGFISPSPTRSSSFSMRAHLVGIAGVGRRVEVPLIRAHRATRVVGAVERRRHVELEHRLGQLAIGFCERLRGVGPAPLAVRSHALIEGLVGGPALIGAHLRLHQLRAVGLVQLVDRLAHPLGIDRVGVRVQITLVVLDRLGVVAALVVRRCDVVQELRQRFVLVRKLGPTATGSDPNGAA
jgi:hypothetical protein